MNEKKKEIVLSIGLLASNRKNTIQKCLESLNPIRKAIPCQLIVTDTGCDEETRQILKKYADTLTEFEWCNDFAKARNANLSHAIGEWYMYLDDDEWFTDTDELIDFFVSGAYRDYEGACYQVRSYQTESGSMFSDDYLSRMIRLTPERHFVGKIHEYLVPIPQKNCLLGSLADHYGYAFRTKEEAQAHFERNHQLVLDMIEEEPENQRWWTHLAQEYICIRDGERLRQLGEDGLKLVENLDDIESVLNRGTFYMCGILACECEHDDDREYQECEKTIADSRNTRLCIAFTKWWKAHSCMQLGKYREAESCLNDYLSEYKYFLSNEREHIIQKEALIVGQCYDDIKLIEAYEILIMAGLKQNNPAYLDRYLGKLNWGNGHPYVYTGMLETILEAFVSMDNRKLFIRTIRFIHSDADVWEEFCKGIAAWKTMQRPHLEKIAELCRAAGHGKGIDCFLEWQEIETALSRGMNAVSYPEYKTWFSGFAENVLGFYMEAYGKNFDQQTELPGACLMAMMIRDAMEYEEDKERFLETMKQCPEVYPRLTIQVKELLTLYIREPERKAKEARAEMQKIKAQLMEQVRAMKKSGQHEEASQVLKQLQGVFPNDLEVAALTLETHL